MEKVVSKMLLEIIGNPVENRSCARNCNPS